MFTKRENEEILEKHLEVKQNKCSRVHFLDWPCPTFKNKNRNLHNISRVLHVTMILGPLQKTVLPSGKANFDNLLSHAEASLMNL